MGCDWLVASFDMIYYSKGIAHNAQAGLRVCCLQTPKDRFSRLKALIKVTYQRHYQQEHPDIYEEIIPSYFDDVDKKRCDW